MAKRPASPTAQLTQARAAVAAGKLDQALAALLAAWRVVPAAELADAIDAVSARASGDAQPPSGKTAKAKAAAWDAAAAAGDPVVRHVLLASLTDTPGNPATLARIELLVAHPPDPRVAAKLCDLVQVPIYNVTVSRTKPFWKRVFGLLAELGDPRIAARVKGFGGAWAANLELNAPERPELAKFLGKVQPAIDAAYAEGVPVLAAADAALVAELGKLLGAAPATSAPGAAGGGGEARDAELLAAVYAAPADDAPRLVYADVLSQRGDVRGEFIALQIARAGQRDPKQAAKVSLREKELLAELGVRWALPISVRKTGLAYERGFLAACSSVEPIDGSPAWATVRQTDRVPLTDATHLTSLRELDLRGPEAFRTFAVRTTPLLVERLSWTGPYQLAGSIDVVDWKDNIAAFSATRVLPELRRLELSGSRHIVPKDMRWAWTSPHLPRLRELRVPFAEQHFGAWLDELDKSQLLAVELWASSDPRYGWVAKLVRADAEARFAIELRAPPKQTTWQDTALTDVVKAMPKARYASLTVTVPKGMEQAYADSIAAVDRI